jgi:hypothetical protein
MNRNRVLLAGHPPARGTHDRSVPLENEFENAVPPFRARRKRFLSMPASAGVGVRFPFGTALVPTLDKGLT